MNRTVLAFALVAGALVAPATAADPGKPVYQRLIEQYPAPKLAEVGGREFKFLIDPAKVPGSPAKALEFIWEQVKAASAARGFKVTEKDEEPLKVAKTYKEYFDTPDQALWKKGYVIRITQKFKKGAPEFNVTVAVKSILPDAVATLAVPLKAVAGDKIKTEAEDNVGMGPGHILRGYVEKGTGFDIPLQDLGKLTLGDFAKFMPELGQLGLPASTQLVGKRAYSVRIKPGAVELTDSDSCGVSMEGWCATEGGAPYLYDFSIGYSDIDFYDSEELHKAGEAYFTKVIYGDLARLAMPDGDSWGGSKVRKLMNRPIDK